MFTINWFRHWDKIFWAFFGLMGLVLAAGGIASLISLEFFVMLGVFMVIIGAGKLASEISHSKLLNYQDDIYKKMHQISQHLEKTFNIASMNKDKTEFRIQKLDQKRSEVERAMERKYRDLAKKTLELEIRMNKMVRAMERKR